ncbi:MAG: acyl-ACP desaturase [Pyrinomonadaceae bacterium]
MAFETNKDVLDWYEGQERTLTPEYISAIPWHEVKNHPLDKRFVPVLLYMRDVETLTEMYHRELQRTPTGRDPYISKFMERWGIEEVTHGEVLNRFLNEAGFETGDKWQSQIHRNVTNVYNSYTYLITTLTNFIGKKFTATHMTFGAIHEMSTAQGYRRMKTLADHPVLTQILNAIIREEAAHTKFYWNIAQLELRKNEFAQKIARFVIDHFYTPVGQGSLAKKRTEYALGTLFGDEDSLDVIDKTVTQRVSQLPGFAGITKINESIGGMARRASMKLNSAL